MGIKNVFSFLFFLTLLFPLFGNAGAVITYHGRILDDNGAAVESSNVTFRIQIYSPNPGKCLLYEETRTISMLGSDGVFVIPIGDGVGARTTGGFGTDPGISMEEVFTNNINLTFNRAGYPKFTCNSGGHTYTPSVLDQRQLVVSFDDGTAAGEQALPAVDVGYVPFAVDSYNAANLDGTPAANILRVSGGAASALTPANFVELLALINGTSTQFSKANQLNGVALPTMTAGQSLGWDGTAWVSVPAPSAGSTSQTGLLQLAADAEVSATKAVKADDSRLTNSRAPNGAASGDLGGTYPSPTVNAIRGNAVATGTIPAPDVGKVYRWNGTSLTASFLNFGDLKTAAGAQQLVAACAANEKIQWSIITDSFTCEAIGSLNASTITAGTIASARLPANVTRWQDGTGGEIYYSGGNIGIGTSDPTAPLHVIAGSVGAALTLQGSSNDNHSAEISSYKSRGTPAVPSAVLANDRLMGLYGLGAYSATQWSDNVGAIQILAKENFTNIAQGTYMDFGTTPAGSTVRQTRMTIDDNGFVGIGTNVPSTMLSVAGTVSANQVSTNVLSMNGAFFSQGTFAGWVNMSVENDAADGYSGIMFKDNTSTTQGAIGFSNPGAGMLPGSMFITSINAYPIVFGTGASNERTRIGSNGAVGIGTSNPGAQLEVSTAFGALPPMVLRNTTPAAALQDWHMGPNDQGNFMLYNSANAGIYLSNGATSWTAISDIRLKKDFMPLENSLEKLGMIKGYTYLYKTDKDGTPRRVGVIAQDVKKVLPEAVSEQDGFFGVRYNELVPLIINAVNELKTEIFANQKTQARDLASVQSQLQDLQSENQNLKSENKKFKEYLCQKDPASGFCAP